MDNRSEKTISRAIFRPSSDLPLIYEPIEPCQPRIFDFRFSHLSFRPETSTLLLPGHQRMDNRSENPIRRTIIDLSPDSPFIYEPIEPYHPLIFWCSVLSAKQVYPVRATTRGSKSPSETPLKRSLAKGEPQINVFVFYSNFFKQRSKFRK